MNFKIAKITKATDYLYKMAGLIQVPEELLSKVEDWAVSYASHKIISEIESIFEANLNKINQRLQEQKNYSIYEPIIQKYFEELNNIKYICRSFIKTKPVSKTKFSFPIKKLPFFKLKDKSLEDSFITINGFFNWKIEESKVGLFDFSSGLEELLDKQEKIKPYNNVIHLGDLFIINCLLVSPSISTVPLEFKEKPIEHNSRYVSLDKDIFPLINQIKETVKHELIHAIQFFISVMRNKYYTPEPAIIPHQVELEGGPSKKFSPAKFDYSKEKFNVYSLGDSKVRSEKKELKDFFEEEKLFNQKLEELELSDLFQLDFAKLWTGQVSLEEFSNSIRGKKIFRKFYNSNILEDKTFPRKFFTKLKNKNPEKYQAYAKQFMLSPAIVPHSLKNQEFYTRLSDEIDSCNQQKVNIPLKFQQDFVRAWLDNKYYKIFKENIMDYIDENEDSINQQQVRLIFSALSQADNRMFFRALAKEHPEKYEKAVKEFFKNTL